MKRKIKRAIAGMVASAVAVSTAAVLFWVPDTAGATSLPHIESIVSGLKSGAEFHILELVPQTGAGSIGYYVSGQEPAARWKTEVGAIKAGVPDARGAYANASAARTTSMSTRLTALTNANLLSSGDQTPLISAGSYEEALPWARSGAGYSALALDHAEKQTVTGVFTKKPDGAANPVGYDYTQQTSYEIVSNGQYVQKIDKFVPASVSESSGETYFYYTPTFELLIESEAESRPDKDIAVYTNLATDADASVSPIAGQYRYYGRLKDGLQVGKVYYYVKNTGAPAAERGDRPYKALLDPTDPYTNVGTGGYFNLTVTGYAYVGDGQGIYQLQQTTEQGAVTLPVTYSTVFYRGGYTNNNWFLTKVLDVNASKLDGIQVNVTSVSPDTMTDALAAQISGGTYQMIVMSGGFLPGGTPASYSAANDIPLAVKNAVSAAAGEKVPLLVDNALTAAGLAGTNIGRLAQTVKSGTGNASAAFVKGSVYFFGAPLATKSLNQSFAESAYKTVGTPYYEVYAEIHHENFLRQTAQPDTADLLDDKVSMAKCIRYVINYGQQRQVSAKAKITVLDIEPLRYRPDTTTKLELTQDDVLTWLPAGSYAKGDITIVTMTTAEFIGKIDDVSEKYDIVYFGPSSYNAGWYDYNDNDMDGLVYTNVGDTYKANNISGLLDRDYVHADNGTFDGGQRYLDATAETKANLYRFSGNDLTAVKVQTLKDFAATGYPVILSNDLLKADGTVSTATVDSASQIYRLFDEIKGRGNVMRVQTAQASKDMVKEYLNLSKPQILFAAGGYPTKYDESQPNKGSLTEVDGVYSLDYRFQIINATDATPLETTYYAALYLDQDGNGNYVASENLADIRCYQVDAQGTLVSVEPTALKAGTSDENAPTYVITRQLPADISGILPWKLEIIKNGSGNEYIHTSQINYAYIKPGQNEAKVLNILQIDTTADKGGYNLENQMTTVTSGGYVSSVSGNRYKGIYGKLLDEVSTDFDVKIYTLYTNDLDALYGKSLSDWKKHFISRDSGTLTYDNNYTTKVLGYLDSKGFFPPDSKSEDWVKARPLSALLQQFDMLIVGFGDTYSDFNENTAPAVLDYIESGKSILFSHDTTSFYNVPSGYKQMTVKPTSVAQAVSTTDWKTSNATVTSSDYNAQKITAKYSQKTGSISSKTISLSAGTYVLKVQESTNGNRGSITFGGKTANFQNGSASINLTVPSRGGNYQIVVNHNGASSGLVITYTLNLQKVTSAQTGSAPTGWGYYFNTVLRSRVGLDRYGIVADDTISNGAKIRDVLKTATDDSTLSADTASQIGAAGYTVAYAAKNPTKTVPEAQGVTNYELLRYGLDNGQKGVNGLSRSNGGTFGTSKVSQVNQGQITTYPYNLNTTQFNPDNTQIGSVLTVTDTHEQYYQLNMNSDDVVVWYCLSNGSYANAPNDVVNSYYIYTVGNVTYTGAGHTSEASSINSAQNEAKLFINTMIAAYRPARSRPSIKAVDPVNTGREVSNYYVTADYSGGGYSGALLEQGGNYPVYFMVTDPNLDATRTTTITLSYQTVGGAMTQYTAPLAVYRAPSGSKTYPQNVNGTSNLVSGMVYYFNLPQEILNAFGAESSASKKDLRISLTTRFGDNTTETDTTDVSLLKVGLWNLS